MTVATSTSLTVVSLGLAEDAVAGVLLGPEYMPSCFGTGQWLPFPDPLLRLFQFS